MREKALGKCETCGSVYPVAITTDGSRRVLGNAGRCECGSREFRLLDADDV